LEVAEGEPRADGQRTLVQTKSKCKAAGPCKTSTLSPMIVRVIQIDKVDLNAKSAFGDGNAMKMEDTLCDRKSDQMGDHEETQRLGWRTEHIDE
jgi:hypothetical protein